MKKLFPFLVLFVIPFSVSTTSFAQNCSEFRMYIDPHLITNDLSLPGYTVEQWKLDNLDMSICEETETQIIVDFCRMNSDDAPRWRERNTKYIDYVTSYPFIEDTHFLDPDIIPTLYHSYVSEAENQMIKGDLVGYTYKELIDEFNIQNSSYNNYLKIVRNVWKNVKVRPASKFDPSYSAFSSPLINAIISQHGPTDTAEYSKCFFSFTIIEVMEAGVSKKVAILKFCYEGMNFYYDFSDDPIRALIKSKSRTCEQVLKKSDKK
jgi:hypothetical protein